jgi:hypothetical protein
MTREEQHLAQADRHIAELEERIVQQQLIAGLPTSSDDAASAKTLLAALEQSLVLACNHRRLILGTIAAERAGQAFD